MPFFTLLLLGVTISTSAFAGVKSYYDRFTLSFSVENHNYDLTFKVKDLENERNPVSYKPNTRVLSGLQATYKWLTLFYKTSAEFTEESIAEKGKTSYEDLRGAIFLGRKDQFFLLGYYNRYKGFYINNTSDIDPSWSTGDPYLQREDIETFNTGVGLLYILDPNDFSGAAAFLQSARQTSSGGSWLFMASFDGAKINAEQALIPAAVQSQFGADATVQDIEFVTLTGSVGYGYSLIGGNFFLTAVALVGWGNQRKKYTIGTESVNNTGTTTKNTWGLSTGYNGDQFFIGLSLVNDTNNFSTRTLTISNSLSSNRIFMGTRF